MEGKRKVIDCYCCGEKTMNKYKNFPICRLCVKESREQRDAYKKDFPFASFTVKHYLIAKNKILIKKQRIGRVIKKEI